MTVRDLIKELRDLPQDLPVVTDYKEITDIAVNDNFYFWINTIKTATMSVLL